VHGKAVAVVALKKSGTGGKTNSPKNEVMQWWCVQPQGVSDGVCATRRATSEGKSTKLIRMRAERGLEQNPLTPMQRRLHSTHAMQARVAAFCRVEAHATTKTCKVLANKQNPPKRVIDHMHGVHGKRRPKPWHTCREDNWSPSPPKDQKTWPTLALRNQTCKLPMEKPTVVCTLATVGSLDDLALFMVSFMSAYTTTVPPPIYLAADTSVAIWVRRERERSSLPCRLTLVVSLDGFVGGRTSLTSAGMWTDFQMQKAVLLRRVLLDGHRSALFVDTDTFFLSPLPRLPPAGVYTRPLGLSMQRVGGNTSRLYGLWNGGAVFVSSVAVVDAWVAASRADRPRSDRPKQWACCADQLALDVLSDQLPYFMFDPGFNFGWFQLVARLSPTGRDETGKIHCVQGKGLWFGDTQLHSLHMHLPRMLAGRDTSTKLPASSLHWLVKQVEACSHPSVVTLLRSFRQGVVAGPGKNRALKEFMRTHSSKVSYSFTDTPYLGTTSVGQGVCLNSTYRLGDEYLLGGAEPDARDRHEKKSDLSTCDCFPQSIGCEYAVNRGAIGGKCMLVHSVRTWVARRLAGRQAVPAAPPKDAVLVHIRLGDTATSPRCFDDERACLWSSRSPYLSARPFYERVVESLAHGASVVIMGSLKHMDPTYITNAAPRATLHTNSRIYLDKVTRFFRARNLSLTTRLGGTPDDDFAFGCQAKRLVCGGSSHFCTTMAHCVLGFDASARVTLDSRTFLGVTSYRHALPLADVSGLKDGGLTLVRRNHTGRKHRKASPLQSFV